MRNLFKVDCSDDGVHFFVNLSQSLYYSSRDHRFTEASEKQTVSRGASAIQRRADSTAALPRGVNALLRLFLAFLWVRRLLALFGLCVREFRRAVQRPALRPRVHHIRARALQRAHGLLLRRRAQEALALGLIVRLRPRE